MHSVVYVYGEQAAVKRLKSIGQGSLVNRKRKDEHESSSKRVRPERNAQAELEGAPPGRKKS